MMRSAWDFIRDHFWAAVIIMVVSAALLYPLIMQSSPAIERTQFDGTIVTITHAGESSMGRPRRYGYQIAPANGDEPVIVRGLSLHRIGHRVTVERVTRHNGNITYRIAGVQPSQ